MLLAFAALAAAEDAAVKSVSGAGLVSVPAVAPIVFSAVAILASFLIQRRLERGSRAIWAVRVAAFSAAALYTMAMATMRDIQSFYYMNFVARIATLSFVGECAIQHWQRPPPGQERSAVLVFLAAIVFVLGSRTYVHGYVKYVTPPFITLLVMSMRAARRRSAAASGDFPPWIAALCAATVLGIFGSFAIAAHSAELTRILVALLKPSNYNDFSDVNARPMLGKSFNQPLSQKRILRIEGAPAERHMRGMAFEVYATTGGWGAAVEARGQEAPSLELKARPGGQRLAVTPLIENLTVLYVPLHMDGLDAKYYRVMWSRDWGGPIYAISSTGPYQPYQIRIADAAHKGPLCGIMNEKVRERCLDLPEDLDPRVATLAHEIEKGAATPREKLEAIRRYLNRNHAYSLTIEPGAGDPVANFLIQKKDGHCQYFASSSVLLLRCMGVPARYVTGFYAHETPEAEVTIVRQRDAHAWAEAWIDGEGWETFDATPSGGMPGQAGAVPYWARLWEKLGDMAESLGAWMREAPVTKLGLVAGVLAALAFALRWFREWREAARQARPRVIYASPGRPYEVLAVAFNDWLKRKGAPCPPQRPWRDHLAGLRRAAAPTAGQPAPGTAINSAIDLEKAEAFVRGYSAARFGGVSGTETIERLNAQLKTLN